MEEKIKQFRKYLEDTIKYYNNAALCSWGEAVNGQNTTQMILDKFNTIFENEKETEQS